MSAKPQCRSNRSPRWRFRAAASLLLLLVSALHSSPCPAQADSLEERFVGGLRERRLFDLAEKYCQRKLESAGITPALRAELAIELVRTYAEHALAAPPRESAIYWELAHRTAADYLRLATANNADPQDRRGGLLMQVQDALTHLAHGELARQEVSLAESSPERLEIAKGELRQAVATLEQASKGIDVALRSVGPGGRGRDGFSLDELEALQRNVSFQLARAFRNQGLCYPAASADRTNSLTQATERLAPLAELPTADETIWRSRLDLIACYRLLGQTQAASRVLGQLVSAAPPAQILLRAMAEKIRLHLALEQLAEAMKAVEQGRTVAGQTSAELDFAHLEAMIAAWQTAAKAKDATLVEQWQRQATAQVQLIEQTHGPYWMRRAETLLASVVGDAAGGDVAALRRAAESYYRGGRTEEAVQTYDRAVAAALAANAGDEAFALAFTAAAVERERKEYAQAQDRFRRLALQLPQQARAAEAHLLAIVSAVDLARTLQGQAQTEQMQQYADLLSEHVQHWPSSATADQAHFWQGKLLESRRDWAGAFAAYQQVRPGHAQHEAAMTGAMRCAAAEVAAMDGSPAEEVAKKAAAAASFGERLILGMAREWPQQWTPLQREAALFAARLRLQYTPGGAEVAERILTAALSGAEQGNEEWLAAARLLLVSAYASQGKTAEAAAEMEQVSSGTATGLLSALESLELQTASAPAKLQPALADLKLRVAALLGERKKELSADQQRQLDLLQAAALARSGRPQEALAAYTALAKQYPLVGEIHESLAALLATSTDRPTQKLALDKWREVERKTKRGESRWFRARLAQAELLHRMADDAAAAKLLQLTAVLQPELGGPDLKPRFEALLKLTQGK